MLHSLQETKYDLFLLLLLPLLQSTQMKLKQQKQQITQPRYESSAKEHFSYLQYIYMYIYVSNTYATVDWDITISY